MEGWFPFERGEQIRLQIAEAADRDPELNDPPRGQLPRDPAARTQRPEGTPSNVAQGRALLNAGVDAGRNTVPVTGEVSLDILLHGNKYKPRFRGGVGNARGRDLAVGPMNQ